MDEEGNGTDTGAEITDESQQGGEAQLDTSSDQGATAQADTQDGHSQPAEESFVDPSTLPPELKGHWSRMHKAFTQSREELKRGREATQMVQRFFSDPQFAEQTLQQRAAQMGYQLVRPGQNGQQNGGYAAQNGQDGQIPHEFVQIAQQNLPPELQWMAPHMAASQVAIAKQIAQQMVEPVMQNTRKQAFDQEFSRYEAELTEKHPDWIQHENTMDEIRAWWQSPSMSHPKYGNKLEWLYKMATEQQASVTEATKRMRAAAKNRSSFSHTPSHSAPNIGQRVAQATSNDEAWDIAHRYALEQARKQGAA